jgi:predicted nucleic acid-binding protein
VILVDTSVWVDHWRRGNDRLAGGLAAGEVLLHPFVVGELACGTLPKRSTTLRLLEALPLTTVARHREVMAVLEQQALAGSGLGWVDIHLLTAASLSSVRLWTLDKALRRAAEGLDVYGECEA